MCVGVCIKSVAVKQSTLLKRTLTSVLIIGFLRRLVEWEAARTMQPPHSLPVSAVHPHDPSV